MKQEQIKMEKEFTYSTYNELKKWFDERLAQKVLAEEEISAWI